MNYRSLTRCLTALSFLSIPVLAATIIVACASLSQFDQAIETGAAALVPAENLACTLAADLDPSGKTAICAVVDTTGALLGSGFTVAEDAAGVAALVQKTAGKVDAVRSLKILEMQKRGAR